MWNLFCLELSKYVTVESLAGTPYMRLEGIGSHSSSRRKISFPFQAKVQESYLNEYTLGILEKFVPYVISKRPFGFNYDGSYSIAASSQDILIILSNLFIEWFNLQPASEQPNLDTLYQEGILKKAKFLGSDLYYLYATGQGTSRNTFGLVGRNMLRFKDKNIKFNIVETPSESDPNLSILLSTEMVRIIIDRILRITNYKYGKDSQEHTTRKSLRFI